MSAWCNFDTLPLYLRYVCYQGINCDLNGKSGVLV